MFFTMQKKGGLYFAKKHTDWYVFTYFSTPKTPMEANSPLIKKSENK